MAWQKKLTTPNSASCDFHETYYQNQCCFQTIGHTIEALNLLSSNLNKVKKGDETPFFVQPTRLIQQLYNKQCSICGITSILYGMYCGHFICGYRKHFRVVTEPNCKKCHLPIEINLISKGSVV